MRRVAWLCTAILAAACVEKGPDRDKQIDPAYIDKNLLGEVPDDLDNDVQADLGGKVVYVGNQVETEAVKPGGKVEVVHYWKIVQPPGDAWRVFSHAVGETGEDWVNVDATDMRAGYPPAKWKKGDVIRDEQSFTLPESWKSDHVDVRLGLYRKGGQRASDRMPIASGPHDDESRIVAVRIPIGEAEAADDAPYAVRKATGTVAIDGRMDEDAWTRAPESPVFARAEGGAEVVGKARARLLWDDSNLYAFISVDDDDVFSKYDGRDDPLWKQDVVELFIDADESGRGYVELQVNPRNAVFDSWFATTRQGGGKPAWNVDLDSAVNVRGSLDDRDDDDDGWDAEIAIPHAAVKGEDGDMDVAIPPAVGDTWRLNVVRVDKPADGDLSASSWSQIPIADFHALGRMVTVTFADEDGETEPPEEDGAGAGGDAGARAKAKASGGAANEPAAAKASGATKAPTAAGEDGDAGAE